MIGSNKLTKLAAALIFAVPTAAFSVAHAAENYPDRAINWVIPFAAGGGSDRLARLMAVNAQEVFGQQVRVVNHPGAGSVAGWQYVLNQPADGYTIFNATPTPLLTLIQEEGSQVDPSDIDIVGYISAFRSILVTREDDFADWDAYLEASQEQPIVIGGTSALLMGVANILDQAGVEGVYVPYDSTGEAVSDLLGGHIQAAALTESTAATIVPEEAIAILNTSNIPLTDVGDAELGGDVPQASDFGFQGMAFPRWVGVHPDTPDEIAEIIAERLGELMQSEAVIEAFAQIGEEVIYVPRAEAKEDYVSVVEQMRNAAALLE